MKRPVLPPAKVHTWHGVTQLPFIDLWSVWHVPSPSYVIFWKTFHLKDTEAEVAWLAGIGERNVSFICWFTAHISHISVIARDGTLERSLCLPSVCEQECGIRNQICDSDSACSCYAQHPLIMPSQPLSVLQSRSLRTGPWVLGYTSQLRHWNPKPCMFHLLASIPSDPFGYCQGALEVPKPHLAGWNTFVAETAVGR